VMARTARRGAGGQRAIEAGGLVKRFGAITALDGFDLDVAAGEIVGLVGHNGAGKTTFARAVSGLLRPDEGTTTVLGLDVALHPRAVRSRLGVAPQEIALYPTATARENLTLFAGLAGLRSAETRRRVDAISDQMALSDILDRRVRDLSGGQQRRVQAATAMVHRPDVLLLDEPTVGADPLTREALLAVVRKAADEGAAIVYTTHYLPELDVLGASLAVADHGRIIARGPRDQLLERVPGRAVLGFDGPPPAVRVPAGSQLAQGPGERDVTITSSRAAEVLAEVLASQPEITRGLRTVDLHPPNLDDLYRHVVGARGA
jgi:ABC-2 type transport system ATP-binding protein